MDWLTFIATIISSLAWPAAIVFLVFFLRVPIRNLLSLVSRLRWGGLEVDIGREIERAEKSAERARLPPASELQISAAVPDSADALLAQAERQLVHGFGDDDSRAAILTSWIAIQTEVLEAAKRKGIDVSPQAPVTEVLEKLASASQLSPFLISVFHGLRKIRNAAAHDVNFNISTTGASEYLDLAARVIAGLRRLA